MLHSARVLVRVAMVAAVLSTGLGAPSPVAAASCNPHRTPNGVPYWMGVGKGLSGITGVDTWIQPTYDPYIQGGGFSYAWAMLPGAVNYEWFQVGPYKSAGGRSTTVQFMEPGFSGPVQYDFPATAIGSGNDYKVLYTSAGGFSALMNGNVLTSGKYLSWAPIGAQIYAEIVNLANQMVGDSSTKEEFVYNKVRNSSLSWSNMTGTISQPTTHFSDSGNASQFYTWDLCK